MSHQQEILAEKLPADPSLGQTTHLTKLLWRYSVEELEKTLPKGWKITGSTGMGWYLEYSPENEDLNPVTVESVKKVVGRTWFDFEDQEDRIMLDTRDNGNVGDETPGQEDVTEGRRLIKALRAAFPLHHCAFEIVDEWVHVDIKKRRKSEREQREEALETLKREGKKLHEPALTAALAAVHQEIIGPAPEGNDRRAMSNYKAKRTPFYSNEHFLLERMDPKDPGRIVVTIGAFFGERLLYCDHLGAVPPFKTPEEAQEALSKLLAHLPGAEVIGKPAIEGPYEKETYNYRPPNNIIERVGTIKFHLALGEPAQTAQTPKPTVQGELTLA
jgi:hypothetical protein